MAPGSWLLPPGTRLALAEINLTTETANLHDASARYQRVVGSPPPNVVVPPGLISQPLPASPKAAVDILHQRNPALLAAIENSEAADYDLYARRAAYSPKLDFRARTDNSNHYLGVNGDRNYNVAELVVSWNLFNGGSDRAREKQYMERKYLSLDLREKACRDTRQTLLIAYNDVQRLKEQSRYLATQVSLLEKTRNAYRDQFNIGQRTLLDLLDTENELLSARRNAVNADADLNLGYLRSYAGMGMLLEVLGLQKLDSPDPEAQELAKVDASQLCPADAIAIAPPDHEALNARALAMLDSRPAAVPAPAAPEAPLFQQVKSWAAAWSAKNYAEYSAFYAPSFVPEGGLSRDEWAQLRRSRLQTRDEIAVEVQDIRVQMEGPERAQVAFLQTYRSNAYRDTTRKTLEMIRVGGQWLINRESSVPCSGNTTRNCKG